MIAMHAYCIYIDIELLAMIILCVVYYRVYALCVL